MKCLISIIVLTLTLMISNSMVSAEPIMIERLRKLLGISDNDHCKTDNDCWSEGEDHKDLRCAFVEHRPRNWKF